MIQELIDEIAVASPLLKTQIAQGSKILLVLLVIDFSTGILASRNDKKKSQKLNKELEKDILIKSSKLRKTGVKFGIYFFTIYLAYLLEITFFIKPFDIFFIEVPLNLSLAVILFWCFVEAFSIVFENFKKMGFDVVQIIKNIASKYKETKKAIM